MSSEAQVAISVFLFSIALVCVGFALCLVTSRRERRFVENTTDDYRAATRELRAAAFAFGAITDDLRAMLALLPPPDDAVTESEFPDEGDIAEEEGWFDDDEGVGHPTDDPDPSVDDFKPSQALVDVVQGENPFVASKTSAVVETEQQQVESPTQSYPWVIHNRTGMVHLVRCGYVRNSTDVDMVWGNTRDDLDALYEGKWTACQKCDPLAHARVTAR